MPKPRRNDLIQCPHFSWRLTRRAGVWQADGRSNTQNAGRHSLGTHDRVEALKLLAQLDATVAADFGLAPRPAPSTPLNNILTLDDGRKLYEEHIKRPRVAGGVRASTQKRYRTVFDKFILFAKSKGVLSWNGVTNSILTSYATHLDDKGYAGKTLRHELTVLVQLVKWLLTEKHLAGVEPLKLTLKKVESERAFCYTPQHVQAMIAHCRSSNELSWLVAVIIGLACTGLRISELASLRWTDIDLVNGHLALTDESGRARRDGKKRREMKSGRSRQLPIHPELAKVLAQLPRGDAHVFHGPRGGLLKPDTLRNILVRDVIEPLASQFPSTSDEQGFKDGRLHSFRHYFASACASSSGVAERVVMEWLGHKDSEMVRHYFHLHDEESRRQMNRLDLLGGAGQQHPGHVNGAAVNNSEEPPNRENSPTTAS